MSRPLASQLMSRTLLRRLRRRTDRSWRCAFSIGHIWTICRESRRSTRPEALDQEYSAR